MDFSVFSAIRWLWVIHHWMPSDSWCTWFSMTRRCWPAWKLVGKWNIHSCHQHLPSKKYTYLRLAGSFKVALKQQSDVRVKYIKTTFPSISLAGCDFHWSSYLRIRISTNGRSSGSSGPFPSAPRTWWPVSGRSTYRRRLQWGGGFGPELAAVLWIRNYFFFRIRILPWP